MVNTTTTTTTLLAYLFIHLRVVKADYSCVGVRGGGSERAAERSLVDLAAGAEPVPVYLGADPAARVAGPPADAEVNLVKDLEELLRSIRLEDQLTAAVDWCGQMGADDINDLKDEDYAEQLAKELGLPPIKSNKLIKAIRGLSRPPPQPAAAAASAQLAANDDDEQPLLDGEGDDETPMPPPVTIPRPSRSPTPAYDVRGFVPDGMPP